MSKEIGLYIHIPFCKSKCHYCDFNSHAGKEALIEPYFHALLQELGYWSHKLSGQTVKTVFIGGGTPSLVEPRHIYELMNTCSRSFHLDKGAEISMESNPGTLSYEKLISYKVSGINRLSMGLQAWQDRLLRAIGRIHTREEFMENFQLAVKAGFRNINVDLMFGLPGQTLQDWMETVGNMVKLGVAHLSCYSLKIEEGTLFGERCESGLLETVDDELDRRMYHEAVEKLDAFGYGQYEISNFTRPGMECRHNLIYWKAEEYLGVGAGAHSYLDGRRFNNTEGVVQYIGKAARPEELAENAQEIDREESMGEYMLLGLRLLEGVSATQFEERYGTPLEAAFGKQLAKLERKQLLEREGNFVRLTSLGLDLANEVFVEFV